MHRRFSLDSLAGATTVSGRRGSKLPKGSKQVDTMLEAHEKIRELHDSLDKNSSHSRVDDALSHADGLVGKNSFRKHNLTFHKLFADVPDTEMLTGTFTCSLQKELIYHGRLFVSEDHICFHSSVLLKHIKVVLTTSSVCEVKRQKAPVPMLSLHTVDGGKYQLMYVKHSRVCHELLRSVCLHVEKQSANSSPVESSPENGHNGKRLSSQSSLEDNPSRKSSSVSLDGSYIHSAAFTGENMATHQDTMSWNEDTDMSSPDAAGLTTASAPNDSPLNVVFSVFCLMFLFLLLVSAFIGLRIIALEEQLTALGELSL